jgi:hypothetical protein
MLVALTTTCLAGGNSALVDNLSKAVKSMANVVWTTSGGHKDASFEFNGKTTIAHYNTENDDLIGFSIHISIAELPAGTTEDVQKKFKGWGIADKILFIDSDGNSSYFALVTDGKRSVALSVSPKGKVNVFSQMP